MRTPRDWIAALRDVFGQAKAASDKGKKSEDDHSRHIVMAINELEAEIKRQGAAANERPRHETQRLLIAWLALGINAITMGAVIIYACYAKGQLDAMHKALDSNERAWLIGRANIKRADNGLLIAMVGFKNVGKSPAFYVRFNVVNTSTPSGPIIELPLSGSGSEITLTQNGEVLPGPWPLAGISLKDIPDIETGHRPLFIWLGIKYSDPFSGDPNVKDRYTQECWVYTPMRRDLAVCQSGNIHR